MNKKRKIVSRKKQNNNFIHQSHFMFRSSIFKLQYVKMDEKKIIWKKKDCVVCVLWPLVRALELVFLSILLPIIIIWYFYVWRLTEYRPVLQCFFSLMIFFSSLLSLSLTLPQFWSAPCKPFRLNPIGIELYAKSINWKRLM